MERKRIAKAKRNDDFEEQYTRKYEKKINKRATRYEWNETDGKVR